MDQPGSLPYSILVFPSRFILFWWFETLLNLAPLPGTDVWNFVYLLLLLIFSLSCMHSSLSADNLLYDPEIKKTTKQLRKKARLSDQELLLFTF